MLWCVRFCFFFKQKTAYEMRISDWSSDVCSSDLFGRRLVATGSNRDAVFRAGIDVRRVKLLSYILAWFFVFLSAVCMSAQTMSGDARLGLPYMLSSVAAVVIGGI